jgi:hypothetical protein
MSKTVHSVKLFPYASVELDRLSYMNGDIVYDSTNGTIRVMNGTSQGGIKLATQTWTSNLLNSYDTITARNTALSSYLTTATASSTYATQASLSSYLTTATASSTYATQASLSSYLTTATASSTYATQASLSSYVTTSSQTSALALKAPIANPVHTGTLTVPTAIIGGVNIKSLAIAMGAALA